MNERIKELAEQAGMKESALGYGMPANVLWGDDQIKNFAELIVQECAGVCEWQHSHKHKDNTEGAFAAIACSDAILEHFGVDE